MKILIGMPAYNEEKKIGPLILSLQKKGYDVLVCDDASSDKTSKISKQNGAMLITHNKNLGYGGAIKTLLTKARELKPDIFVTFDSDGQHDFNDIDSLVTPILEKKYDIVIGSRFLDKKSKIPKYREFGIKSITKLTNLTHNIDVTDSQSGLRAYGSKALDLVHPSEEGMGISTEILIKASQNNLKIGEIPIVISYDGNTSTHNPASHGLSVIGTTLKFLSIKHPLIFYGIPGLLFLIVGLSFTVWTLTNFAESRLIATNLALISVGSIILGVLLLLTAIILFSLISVIREKN
jgi:glycosyltransferase involved in cell wall biosynthesis